MSAPRTMKDVSASGKASATPREEWIESEMPTKYATPHTLREKLTELLGGAAFRVEVRRLPISLSSCRSHALHQMRHNCYKIESTEKVDIVRDAARHP